MDLVPNRTPPRVGGGSESTGAPGLWIACFCRIACFSVGVFDLVQSRRCLCGDGWLAVLGNLAIWSALTLERATYVRVYVAISITENFYVE